MLKVPGRDGRLLFWPDQALSTAGMLVRVVTEFAPLVELTRWRFDSISLARLHCPGHVPCDASSLQVAYSRRGPGH